MAAKYLGPAFDIHGGGVDLRFPHHENELAQSRAAGQAFASYWLHNAWITTAGEKMSKSLGNSLLIPEVLKRVRGIELRFYMVSAHYRSHVEFSFEALDEAAQGFRRIESFLDRAGEPSAGGRAVLESVERSRDRLPAAFAAALDDDLGTPAAIAVIHEQVREGNRRLAAGESAAEVAAQVVAMLDVLGLNPADPAFSTPTGSDDAKLGAAVDALVAGLLEERAAARADKDWTRARRDPRPDRRRRHRGRGHPRRTEVDGALMPGNSKRKGAIRKSSKRPTAGSGGRVRQGLEGKGPTPKAADRPNHKAHKFKNKAEQSASARPKRRSAGDDEWIAGRNSVVEALRAGVPVSGVYVAEGTERDARLREAFKLAAEGGISLLEVTRAELDRRTDKAVHQGLAARIPAYEYAHPSDLLDDAAQRGEAPLIVALDSVTDPRNLGAVVRSAAAFGAHGVVVPERRAARMTASAWKSSAGAAARLPVAHATNLVRTLKDYQDAGCQVVGLAASGDLTLPDLLADPDLAAGPLVVVVGSEGDGLSRLVGETCDRLLSIPMASSVESLNAGVAASIALYALAQHR